MSRVSEFFRKLFSSKKVNEQPQPLVAGAPVVESQASPPVAQQINQDPVVVKKARSKYLNKIFDGWKVVTIEQVNNGVHKRFKLYNPMMNASIIVRDNELTKLMKNEKTVRDLLNGKIYEFDHNIRPEINKITSHAAN